MKLFIDTANLDEIREANSLGVLDGDAGQHVGEGMSIVSITLPCGRHCMRA